MQKVLVSLKRTGGAWRYVPAWVIAGMACCCSAIAADDETDTDADREEPKMEVLAEHRTLARYRGAAYQLCRGRTARCPDRCGDSGEFAKFEIVEYLHYRKPGKYGDAKQEAFTIQISDFDRKPKGDPKTLKTVRGLKEGDLVLLAWNHLYGEVQPGLISPTRPVLELTYVNEMEAAKLRAKAKNSSP